MGWEERWRDRVGEVENGVGRDMWRCEKFGGGGGGGEGNGGSGVETRSGGV